MRYLLPILLVTILLITLTACSAPSPVFLTPITPTVDANFPLPQPAASVQPARAIAPSVATAPHTPVAMHEPDPIEAPATAVERSAQPLAAEVDRSTIAQYLDLFQGSDHSDIALIGRTVIAPPSPPGSASAAPIPSAVILDLNSCVLANGCFTEDERSLLASGLPGVERDGAQLRIRHLNGSISQFTNTHGQGGGGWATYRYLGYAPEIAQHLLVVNYYEGGDYILLAADDGAATVLWTLPTLAPDNQHLAAVGPIPFSETDTLRIQIWRIEAADLAAWHSLDIEHMGDFVTGYQVVPQWTGPDTLQIHAVDQDGRDAGMGTVTIQLGVYILS